MTKMETQLFFVRHTYHGFPQPLMGPGDQSGGLAAQNTHGRTETTVEILNAHASESISWLLAMYLDLRFLFRCR